MIEAASDQLGELIDELSLAARIESGRYDPKLERVSTDDLAAAAVERLGDDRVAVSGQGADVLVDPESGEAVGVGARAVRAPPRRAGAGRSGGRGAGAAGLADHGRRRRPWCSAQDLRDLGAAVAVIHVERLGGSVSVDGDTLTVRLP